MKIDIRNKQDKQSSSKKILAYGISGLLIFQAHGGFAAVNPSVTQAEQVARTTTEAGRLSQTLATTPAAVAPAASGKPTIAQQAASQLSPEAAKVTFKLTKIIITDATVFTPRQLIAPYQSYIGKVASLGDMQIMAQEMTIRYQKAGYVLTRVVIPPQNIKDGVITLRVVEGYIDKINVQGNVRPRVADLLKQYGQHISGERPLQIKQLERYALLANDLPGVSARVVLTPSKTAVGAADLTFVVQQQTLDAYITADNRGTRFLGPEQVSMGANVNSIFRPGDSTGVQYVTTGNKELSFLQLLHSEPIGTHGLRLSLSAGLTRAQPGSYLNDLEIVGKGKTTNVDLSYPLIRSRSQNLYLHAGVGTLDSQTTIIGTDLYNDHIRFANAGFSYSKADAWLGMTQMGLDVTQGLNLLGASRNINISRVNARPGFLKYNFNLSRLQGLTHNFSLLLAAQGQYTNDPQYAAEQFGFGGSNFGRGYDPSEITGDRGAAAKAELRYDTVHNQFYAFYDIGSVWNINTLSQEGKARAASTGVGIRSNITSWLSSNLEVDKPLTRTVSAEGDRNFRVYFGVTISGSKDYKAPVNNDAEKAMNNIQSEIKAAAEHK